MNLHSIFVFACLLSFASSNALAQAALENPQPSSFQSGIGIISGWSCTSGVQVAIDGSPLNVAYGTGRGDVASTCGGNANVGFGLLVNYNTLGNGAHVAQLKVNGANVGAAVPFTVTVPQGEFPLGLSGTVTLNGFPSANKSVTLQWQQSQQNFAITAVNTTTTSGDFPFTFKGIRLDGLTMAPADGGAQVVEPGAALLAPLLERIGGQPDRERLVAGQVAHLEERGGRVEILGGEADRLLGGARADDCEQG